jgi:hypothetical protein
MEISGKVIASTEVVSGESNGKEWKRCGFAVAYKDGKYDNTVYFSLSNKMVEHAPIIGDAVTVQFTPKSREYNGKWYTELNVWKIQKLETPNDLPF